MSPPVYTAHGKKSLSAARIASLAGCLMRLSLKHNACMLLGSYEIVRTHVRS